jgi:DNA-binding NtrC family response regulator
VVATSVGDEELVVRVLRLGAWDYVPKHGDYIQSLPAILRNAIAEYRRLRDHGHAWRRRQRRILYTERHAADIDLTVAQFAENAPYLELKIVRSARDALAALQASRFDLVLTDLRMQDMSALDLLREMRYRELSVPVIVITGKGDEMTAVAALKLGASDYIVKREDYLTQLP